MIPAIGRHPDTAAEMGHGVTLVIDESLPVRSKLVAILEKIGSASGEIMQATTADEALAAFRAHRPSIVFTELIGVHPEDGLDVIHAMLEANPEARIVLVTAEPRDSAEIRAAVRAGVFAIVEKPLRYDKIRAVLADIESEEGGIERLR